MFNKLEEIIKKIEGNVLVFCLENKLLDVFDKNNRVNLYSIASNSNQGIFSKSKKKITNKGKKVNIKRLRKHINKKSINYIVCNMDEMKSYYKYFIKDSIYLNNNTIYIYGSQKEDEKFITERYKRYNVKITSTEYKTGYIIKIDNTLGKNHFFKDKLYFIKDTFYNVAEVIGNILLS